MNIKIADIMQKSVVTTMPHKTLGHARDIMKKNGISSVPVVNSDNEPVGIITTSDLTKGYNEEAPVSQFLSGHLYTVPAYNQVHIAARMMRNHHIHHIIVTNNKAVVGIISSFDLLLLVEDHRFVMKNPSTASKKSNKRD